jgi:hypothetical protein
MNKEAENKGCTRTKKNKKRENGGRKMECISVSF